MLPRESKGILELCAIRSSGKIQELREACQSMFGEDASLVVGINGSYARREATKGSDIDLFFLTTQKHAELIQDKQDEFRAFMKSNLGLRLPSIGGVFEHPLSVDDVMEIGGQPDDNTTITRRMLLLLEGEWLFNKEEFEKIRDNLLERYLHDKPAEDKICMFLLNDIIRYWRTICVDLEHKIYGGQRAREIRLIKLRFSRMLLYASGVFAVGSSFGLPYREKLQHLRDMFAIHAIERMRSIVGDEFEEALGIYGRFLEALDDPEIRGQLEKGGPEAMAFLRLSCQARLFRDKLYELLCMRFPEDEGNPTVRALLL